MEELIEKWIINGGRLDKKGQELEQYIEQERQIYFKKNKDDLDREDRRLEREHADKEREHEDKERDRKFKDKELEEKEREREYQAQQEERKREHEISLAQLRIEELKQTGSTSPSVEK